MEQTEVLPAKDKLSSGKGAYKGLMERGTKGLLKTQRCWTHRKHSVHFH